MFVKKCSILYHLDNYRDIKNEDGIRFDDEDEDKMDYKNLYCLKEIDYLIHSVSLKRIKTLNFTYLRD